MKNRLNIRENKIKITMETVLNTLVIITTITLLSVGGLLMYYKYFITKETLDTGIFKNNSISSRNLEGEDIDILPAYNRYIVIVDTPKRDDNYYEDEFRVKHPNDIVFINKGSGIYRYYTSDKKYYNKVLGLSSSGKLEVSKPNFEKYMNEMCKYDNKGNRLSDKKYNEINKVRKLIFLNIFKLVRLFILMFILLILLSIINLIFNKGGKK